MNKDLQKAASMPPEEYLRRIYGGLLGKCAGVRLGAPLELPMWTYENIYKTFGEITDYVRDYTHFAADDDINGPLFFIRALLDEKGPLTSEAVSRAWLNYTREGIGFFWWGGFGISTEHTAYLNLKNGIPAPDSGSIRVNGAAIAEQIGGQIFIDPWGWIFPGDAHEAARAACMAAGVSHDGNGLYGAGFIAACNSLAFVHNDVGLIIEKALNTIPADSEYARVVNSVRAFYEKNPEDWRAAREMLSRNFGYDRYPGVCHIIPNAGVCALALLYGNGNFARTIEIAVMCGWDTDCNAGNAGAIAGVLTGPEGIPDRYRKPINDWHAAASISGALNNINLPTAARELAILGYQQAGKTVPEYWKAGAFTDDLVFDFTLPGSTCGMRTSSESMASVLHAGNVNGRGITFALEQLSPADIVYLYNKPYYTREDFDDERYSPSFTPLVYPGQVLRLEVIVKKSLGNRVAVAPFVRDARTQKPVSGSLVIPNFNETFSVEWIIPETEFAVAEAGLAVMNPDFENFDGFVTLLGMSITGPREFKVLFADEQLEFGGLSRCSASGGFWSLENRNLHVVTPRSFLLYTGPYYTTDSDAAVELIPENGLSHLLAFRSRGAEYGYFFGLHGKGRAALIRRDHTDSIMAESPFNWKWQCQYSLSVQVRTQNDGSCLITCFIDGKEVIKVNDSKPHPYGMAGAALLMPGRTQFVSVVVKEFA